MSVSASAPSSHPLFASAACANLLAHLSDLVGVPVVGERARQAISNTQRAGAEPLDLLVNAAAEINLRISPARMTLADAVWLANDTKPVIVWSKSEQDWIVIRRHGFFRACVSSASHPTRVDHLTRTALAKRLGLDATHDKADFAVVLPTKPVQAVADDHLPSPRVHAHGTSDSDHPHLPPARRFLALMRPELRDIWTIVLFSVVTGMLYLALPLAVNALVSNVAFGSQSGPFQQALVVLGILLFLALSLAAVLNGLQYYIVEVIQRRLFVRLTADLAHRLPRIDARSIDGVHAPELVNRFLDVVTMQKSTSMILLTGINLVLSALIGMTVLTFYHPYLLAFSLILIAFLAIVIFVFGRGAVSSSIAESHCKYHVVSWLEELARCPRLFKGPGGYELAIGRADDLARDYLSARRRHFRILIRQIGGLLALEVIASAVLLTVGGWLVINQQLTLGQLVASEIIVTAIVAAIAKLGKQFEAWYDMLASVDKIGHLIDLEVERDTGDSPTEPSGGASVDVQNISFAYQEGHPVFCNVSFALKAGEHAALFGSQGSGTSTMLDLLHGLRQPQSGHILINDLDLRSWYLESLRRQVTLIRSSDIVNGSIAENIRLGRRDISLAEVNQALLKVGLLEDVLELPDGVHTPLLAGGLPLSSRQRIRLQIARALVIRPRLLLLDEIFDGLDEATLKELAFLVLDPSNPWTVVVSTRHSAVLGQCQRVIDLDAAECHDTSLSPSA